MSQPDYQDPYAMPMDPSVAPYPMDASVAPPNMSVPPTPVSEANMSVTPPGWTPPVPSVEGDFLAASPQGAEPLSQAEADRRALSAANKGLTAKELAHAGGGTAAHRLPGSEQAATAFLSQMGGDMRPVNMEEKAMLHAIAEKASNATAEWGNHANEQAAQAAAAREDERAKGVAAGAEVDAIAKEGGLLSRMSTTERVLTALAQGLGAFAAVTTHQNPAKDILEARMRDDIENQRTRFAAAKEKVAKSQTRYGILRQAGLDDAEAVRVAMQMDRQHYADEAARLATSASDPRIRVNALELNEQLRAHDRSVSNAELAALGDQGARRDAGLAAAAKDALKVIPGTRGRTEREILDASIRTEHGINHMGQEAPKPGDAPLMVPDGRGGAVRVSDPATYRRLQEKAEATKGLAAIIDELTVLQAKPSLSADDYRRKQFLKEEGGRKASKTQDDSAQRDAEAKRWEAMVGNNIYDPTPVAALRDWRARAVANYGDAVKAVSDPAAFNLEAGNPTPAGVRPGVR